MIKIKKLRSSFKYAFQGLRITWREEQSFRIQVTVAAFVVLLMFCLSLHYIERAILLLAIGFVLGLELLNSQLERVLDFLQPNHDSRVKAVKDLAAAAVLIASIAAILVGLFIFIPHLV